MKDQEEDISRMISGLSTVDAPEGFEGAVRTRIAERRQESPSRATAWLIAKFAFPMVLLLLLGGFFIVSNDGVVNVEMVPAVGDGKHEIADINFPPVDPPPNSPAITVNGASVQPAANRTAPLPTVTPQGTSQDLARSPDDSMIFPDGVDPRNVRAPNTDSPAGGRISPISLLSMMGILSACSPVSCEVREVRDSSMAQRAGLRVGDSIKKIGNRPIDSFHSTAFEVNSLEIVRDGKPMTITFGRR